MSEQKLTRQSDKPLHQLQAYLVELKVSVVLLKELLVEIKELVIIVSLIAFFVWGVIQLFQHLHG